MHRFRINLCGSDAAVARASEDLQETGGLPIGPREPSCWVWESEVGLEDVARFSRRHPALWLGVEGFEDFQDEIVSASVIDGEVVSRGTRGLLPDGWGSFHDEDGEHLDPELLAWAGSVIGGRPSQTAGSSLFSGLETALAIGEEIGRLVADTRDFLAVDAPSERALHAIARLAHLALRVSAAARSRTAGELRYLLALRLTQSVVHAGKSEYADAPGSADWQWWLGILLSSAGELIDEARMCDVVPAGPDPAISPGLDHRDQGEAMELSARSLVTSCVEALALFGSGHPARDRLSPRA